MKHNYRQPSNFLCNSLLHKSINLSLFILLFIAGILPTGQFYGSNIKLITITVIFILFLVDLLINRKTYMSLIYCFGSYVFLLSAYACLGIINGSETIDVASHISAISGTYLIVFLPYYAMKTNVITGKKLFIYILSICTMHCLIKVIIESLLLLQIITITEFQAWLYTIFHFEVITLNFSGLIRINSANDFVIPVCIFGLMVGKQYGVVKLSDFAVALILLLFIFCTYLTYSRFLWFMSGIAFLFGFIIYVKSMRDRRKLIIYSGYVLILAIVVVSFIPDQLSLFDEIAKRYIGEDAQNSDLDRVIMQPLLYSKFLDSPYFGHGLGAYVETYIRFDYLPWNYELHWLALLMQIGIFGILYQTSYFVFIFKKLYLGANLLTLGLYSLLSIVLISGLFNCFIFTSAMGVVLLYLIVTAIVLEIIQKNTLVRKHHVLQ